MILHVIIGRDGTIKQLDPICGPPILVEPSMEAVKRGRYRPTQLSGEPVEVDTIITVVYTLGG